MEQPKPAELVPQIVEMLSPFESSVRLRIVNAALTMLGEVAAGHSPNANAGGKESVLDSSDHSFGPKANIWLKQNELAADDIELVFHLGEGNVAFIGHEIPGKSKKEQTHNAYVLLGITRLIASGEAKFDDKDARAFCIDRGCYDGTNHATFMKDKGNSLTGSKDAGWSLTAPGLKQGAILVKQLIGQAKGA
ncbi:MAG: hypothetical protein U1E67_23585 [Hyphomicrobiales bacterium]